MEEQVPDRRAARERIDLLLDEGSFSELGHADDVGVITGFGTVDDRPVCLFSQGVLTTGDADRKIVEIIDLALATGCPLVGFVDGGRARVHDGVHPPLERPGEILRRHSHASGVIPQISLIMGTATGVQAQAAALADVVIMVDEASRAHLVGPDDIETVTGEDVSAEELGGGRTHATRSGTAHYLAVDEPDAISFARELLSYLPPNNLDDPVAYDRTGHLEPTDEDRVLDSVLPDSRTQPYDVREVVSRVLDDGALCEVHELFAPNVAVGFGRVDGRSVGVVANQPLHLAGFLDIDAAEKVARFVRTCDAFNLPVITFVDAPGFLPDLDQEWNGLLRRGATLAYAYAEATVPLVTMIIGKAYGDAGTVMASKQLGADASLAWPTAQIAPLSPFAAVNALHHDELAGPDDPEARRAELIRAYERERATPALAVEHGVVDAVIAPHRTRVEITRLLRLLHTKRTPLPPKKHGNIPL